MPETRTRLTAFLLRPDRVDGFTKALVEGQAVLPLEDPLDGFVLPLPSTAHPPSWVAQVESLLATSSSLNLFGQSPAALMVIRRGRHTFAVTFGHAWQKLEDEWLERDFGRRVVLNAVSRDQLIAVKSEQVFAKWHRAVEQAPRASSVEEFNIEFDRDLVAAVEGATTGAISKRLGASLRGATSLRFQVPIDEIGDSLDSAAKLFASDAYKKVWPEIDNLAPVKDERLIAILETKLDDDFAAGHAQKRLVLFTPSSKDEDLTVDSYVFGRMSQSPPKSPYLSVEFWINYLTAHGETPSVGVAKSTAIHFLSDTGDGMGKVMAFDCFGYELHHEGQTYILSSGVWYEVVAKFIKRITDTVKSIPAPKIALPVWDGIQHEDAYNLSAAQATKSLCFDAKWFTFGGSQSKFEFCDFMHPKSRTLCFAKIASKSSGMSHLMEQVRRTSELLFGLEPVYRSRLQKVFTKHYPQADTKWLDSRPKPGDWQLCFVSMGRSADKLPFFARCGLARAVKDLQQRGHDVAFAAV